VQYDSGSGYQTVATYARGTNFNNNTFYVATVTLNSNLVNGGKIRFRCDASGNNDHIYIDAVTVTGISGARTNGNSDLIKELSVNHNEIEIDELTLAPNPVNDVLSIRSLDEMTNIKVYSASGQLVHQASLFNSKEHLLNVQEFNNGLYILSIETVDEILTKRFIKN
jgi:hypothetical protein